MGKGDKKTGKGKRAMGSYGNTRQKKTTTHVSTKKVDVVVEKPVAEKPKKAPAKKASTKKVAE